ASFSSSSAERIIAPSRAPERSHAVPTPHPVPNSAMVPVRVAASAASSRPVSLRQKDTYPARRETSNARETIGGRSGGALMTPLSQTVRAVPGSDAKSRIVGRRRNYLLAAAGFDLPSIHHAERVRIHRPPRRGHFGVGHLVAEFGVSRPAVYEPLRDEGQSCVRDVPRVGPGQEQPRQPVLARGPAVGAASLA